MAFKLGFAALGRFAKSNLFARMRQKLFGKMKPGFLKCVILRAEPVDITTGDVSVDQEDFTLPGRIPIHWVRAYRSGNPRVGACGHGWETPADIRLEVFARDGSAVFLRPDAAAALFPKSPAAESDEAAVMELWDGALLSDHGDEFRVRTKGGLIYHFDKALAFVNGDGAREHPLTRISDLCGNWLAFERSGRRLVRIRESAGRRIEIATDGDLIRQVAFHALDKEFEHVFVQYGYDIAGNLLEVRDALGNPSRFAYDQHHMVRHTDRNGLSFYYKYEQSDADWRVIHTWGDGGLYDYRFGWLDEANEVRITDSLGGVSVVTLDDRRLPISEIDPLGGVTVYEYDDVGRTTAVIDQDGHRTSYEYDDRGNLTKLTRPDGTAILVTYDRASGTICVTDAGGGVWAQATDHRGRITSRTTPLGARWAFEYNSRGDAVSATDSKGREIRLKYDAFGKILSINGPGSRATILDHDVFGRQLRWRDAEGRQSASTYDEKGRLLNLVSPEGSQTSFEYDNEDNLIRHVEPDGTEIRYQYIGLGRMGRQTFADGSSIDYFYDTEERFIGLTNQNGEHFRLELDALGRVTAEIDYWGQVWRRSYTSAGRLLGTEDPLGQRVSYETDKLGRVIGREIIVAGGTECPNIDHFEYDPNGNLITIENSTVRVERTFDADGRMIKEQQGPEFLIGNSRDADGNTIARSTKLTVGELEREQTVTFRFDLEDRLIATEIDQIASIEFIHDAASRQVRQLFGADLIHDSRYRGDGLLVASRVMRTGTPLLTRIFEWDRMGQLTARWDPVLGSQRLGYDKVGRVIETADTDGTTTLAPVNPNGDLLTTGRGQLAGEGDPNSWARVGRLGDVEYHFDRAGRLTCKVADGLATIFKWDALHRLVESRCGERITTYYYDAIGRRVSKKSGPRLSQFFWSGARLTCEVVCFADDSGALVPTCVSEWVYDRDSFVPIANLFSSSPSSNEVHYFLNDPNGCPSRLIDGSGAVIWSATYTAWGGAATDASSAVKQPLRLQGQYADEETGLHYNFIRYYDPSMGQFISRDPLRLDAGSNLYRFAPNIWNWIDPLGLMPCHVQGIFPDTITKGVHIDASNGVELKVLPDHLGGITFKPVFSGEGAAAVRSAISEATEDLAENPEFRAKLADTAERATSYLVGQGAAGKSAETAFLSKALAKML
jgi:RHS repeat-associated protein